MLGEKDYSIGVFWSVVLCASLAVVTGLAECFIFLFRGNIQIYHRGFNRSMSKQKRDLNNIHAILNQEAEEKEHAETCGRIAILHKALESLKKDYPMEYEIIQFYYFSEKKITQREIGIKRHITKQAVNKLLKNAYKHLKQYIIINENND